MNRREVFQLSALGILAAQLGQVSALDEPDQDDYRYGPALDATEMYAVEEGITGVGAASGKRTLPKAPAFAIPVFFDRHKGSGGFVKSQDVTPLLDPHKAYRMAANLRAVHIRQALVQSVKADTLQVRTLASVGRTQHDWLTWLILTALQLSDKSRTDGLVGLGKVEASGSLKDEEAIVIKDGTIQLTLELFGETKSSWFASLLKLVGTVADKFPILAEVALPRLSAVTREFVMRTIQKLEREKTERVIVSHQGSYGITKNNKADYKLVPGLWAVMALKDLQDHDYLKGHTVDYDSMEYAIKSVSTGESIQANYIMVNFDFIEQKG